MQKEERHKKSPSFTVVKKKGEEGIGPWLLVKPFSRAEAALLVAPHVIQSRALSLFVVVSPVSGCLALSAINALLSITAAEDRTRNKVRYTALQSASELDDQEAQEVKFYTKNQTITFRF